MTDDGGPNDAPIDDEPFDNELVLSESSKREYLLAQIRQKDAIIESLLKQVRRISLICYLNFYFLSLTSNICDCYIMLFL